MSVVYLTDLCCDLPASYAKKRNLTILPLAYKIGDREITQANDPTMPIETFYQKMREGEMASTAQINTHTFLEAFRPILQGGDDVFYVAFSSGLSGTCQSALLARDQLMQEFPDRKIYVLDTLQACLGQGLCVHYALNLRDEGKTGDEVYAWMQQNIKHFCAWFTVSDLQFIRRGGRVTATAAFLGTMLNIKPVMHVDNDGHLIPIEKVKGRPRSLRALVDHMEKTAIDPANQSVFIGHGDCVEDANAVADMIRERFGTKDFLINHIGPVIGAHSGPDTIALFFFGENRY